MYIRLHIKISYQYRSHFLYIFHLLIPRCAMTQCQKKKPKKPSKTEFSGGAHLCAQRHKALSLTLKSQIRSLSATNPIDQWFSTKAVLPVEGIWESLGGFFWLSLWLGSTTVISWAGARGAKCRTVPHGEKYWRPAFLRTFKFLLGIYIWNLSWTMWA